MDEAKRKELEAAFAEVEGHNLNVNRDMVYTSSTWWEGLKVWSLKQTGVLVVNNEKPILVGFVVYEIRSRGGPKGCLDVWWEM